MPKSSSQKPTRKELFDKSVLPKKLQQKASQLCDKLCDTIISKMEGEYNIKAMPNGTPLSPDQLSALKDRFDDIPLNRLLKQSLANIPVSALAEDREVLMNVDYAYSTTMDKCPKATNQYNSGRCWLFAALNAMRYILINKFNLQDTFELSEAYLFFYDKLERANYFLENMIALRKRSLNDEIVVGLLTDASPVCDGGTWDFFVNLVQKYGVTPKTIYDECLNSMSTEEMNEVLMEKLSEFMHIIRASKLSDAKLRQLKNDEFIPIVYNLLIKFMGAPQQKFDWKYHEAGETFESVRDKGAYHVIPNLSPNLFYENFIESDFCADGKIALVHDPRSTSTQYQCYTVGYFGNMVGGRPCLYHNVPLSVLKEATSASLKDGCPVWFACDVGKKFCFYKDLLSVEAFNFEQVLGVDLPQTKEQRLTSRISAPTHAMLLVGVDINDAGEYQKWRIENSWGENNYGEGSDPGYLQMSDKWFDDYVFEVVVDPKYIDQAILDKLMKTHYHPIELEFNDPFGAVSLLR